MKKYPLLKILGFTTVALFAVSCEFSFGGGDSSMSIINTGELEKVSSKHTLDDLNESRGKSSFLTKGKKKILILPITVKGYERNATESNKENIIKTFFGDASETAWNSVSSFYYKSSYGKLDISGTVADWYDCGYTAEEIASLGDESQATGVRTILNAAVDAYKKTSGSDCSEFDYDQDGYIDGVWMIYSCPNYTNDTQLSKKTFWAYTYWNNDSVADPTNPVANAFCWGSYDFMFDGYGIWKLDAHTYIHETAHMMGAEDYYDYYGNCCPMGCIDMLDYNIIDHNAFTKFEMGWVTPYLVTEDRLNEETKTATLTLRPSQSTGDCVIIPTSNGWNGSVFDEYMMIEYYSPTGLNLKDSTTRYKGYPLGFSEYGVRIYHVDARLAKISNLKATGYTNEIETSTTTYTDLAHSNTPYLDDGHPSKNWINGTKDRSYCLIQEMDCYLKRNFAINNPNNIASNSSLFQTGDIFSFEEYKDSFPNKTTMNDGSEFSWYISFGKMSASGIEVTFSLEAPEV